MPELTLDKKPDPIISDNKAERILNAITKEVERDLKKNEYKLSKIFEENTKQNPEVPQDKLSERRKRKDVMEAVESAFSGIDTKDLTEVELRGLAQNELENLTVKSDYKVRVPRDNGRGKEKKGFRVEFDVDMYSTGKGDGKKHNDQYHQRDESFTGTRGYEFLTKAGSLVLGIVASPVAGASTLVAAEVGEKVSKSAGNNYSPQDVVDGNLNKTTMLMEGLKKPENLEDAIKDAKKVLKENEESINKTGEIIKESGLDEKIDKTKETLNEKIDEEKVDKAKETVGKVEDGVDKAKATKEKVEDGAEKAEDLKDTANKKIDEAKETIDSTKDALENPNYVDEERAIIQELKGRDEVDKKGRKNLEDFFKESEGSQVDDVQSSKNFSDELKVAVHEISAKLKENKVEENEGFSNPVINDKAPDQKEK